MAKDRECITTIKQWVIESIQKIYLLEDSRVYLQWEHASYRRDNSRQLHCQTSYFQK